MHKPSITVRLCTLRLEYFVCWFECEYTSPGELREWKDRAGIYNNGRRPGKHKEPRRRHQSLLSITPHHHPATSARAAGEMPQRRLARIFLAAPLVREPSRQELILHTACSFY